MTATLTFSTTPSFNASLTAREPRAMDPAERALLLRSAREANNLDTMPQAADSVLSLAVP